MSVIVRPIIVLGAPRSGTTILRNCLALHPDLWHLPGESHAVLEGPFHPSAQNYESNRVDANELGDLAGDLRRGFVQASINLNLGSEDPAQFLRSNSLTGRVTAKAKIRWAGAKSMRCRPNEIRFLEKTPKNMLRVPMLARLFPDAYFVHLTRDAPGNVASLTEGWRASDRIGPFTRQRFARSGYPIADQLELQDYASKWWKFALVPEWRSLRGKRLADVAAWQYCQCNRIALADLAAVEPARVRRVRHEEFLRAPVTTLRELFEWAELPPSPVAEHYAEELPTVNTVAAVSANQKDGPDGGRPHSHSAGAAIAATPGLDAVLRDLGYS